VSPIRIFLPGRAVLVQQGRRLLLKSHVFGAASSIEVEVDIWNAKRIDKIGRGNESMRRGF
jgi:hypothetical protein